MRQNTEQSAGSIGCNPLTGIGRSLACVVHSVCGMTDTQQAKQRERFNALQRAAQQSAEVARHYAIDLEVKYSRPEWAKRSERNRLEQLRARANRHQNRLYEFLATFATRDFTSGVPCHWVVSSLTYDDATTAGPMVATPPPAWGYTAYDAQQFALAARERG